MKKMKKPGSWNFSKNQPKEHGALVIDKNFQPGNGPQFLVEIYDTYRE